MIVTPSQVAEIIAKACPTESYRDKRVLLIVPDGTRTAPVGLVFQALHQQIAAATKSLDVLIALGTHQPMNEAAICQRLEISAAERKDAYGRVKFFNHTWNDPASLTKIGTLSAEEIKKLTNGLFAMEVPVEINRLDNQILVHYYGAEWQRIAVY